MNNHFLKIKQSYINVSVNMPDKYFEYGVKKLLSQYKNIIILNSNDEITENFVIDLIVTDYKTLLQLHPKIRMKLIDSAKIMLIDNSVCTETQFKNLLAKGVSLLRYDSTIDGLLNGLNSLFSIPNRQHEHYNRLSRFTSTREILTRKEFEVLSHIAKGENTNHISSVMSLSPKTVSFYKLRAMKKLNMASNIALYYWLSCGGLESGLPTFLAL